jgi:hypothetical protein
VVCGSLLSFDCCFENMSDEDDDNIFEDEEEEDSGKNACGNAWF